MPTDCKRFAHDVASALSASKELTAEAVAHATQCPACAELMRSLSAALTPDSEALESPPPAERSVELARSALKSSWRWSVVRRGLVGLFVVLWTMPRELLSFIFPELAAPPHPLGFPFSMLWPSAPGPSSISFWTGSGLQGLVSATLFSAIAVVFWYLGAVDLNRGSRPSRLHCRWKGYRLEGVCAGLAEYFAVPIWVTRLVFVALALVDFRAVALYVQLGVVMSFHPDDREHLMVFRLRRFIRRIGLRVRSAFA